MTGEKITRRGECQYCYCTDEDACQLNDGTRCAWADKGQTLCTNPDCLAADKADKNSGTRKATHTRR